MTLRVTRYNIYYAFTTLHCYLYKPYSLYTINDAGRISPSAFYVVHYIFQWKLSKDSFLLIIHLWTFEEFRLLTKYKLWNHKSSLSVQLFRWSTHRSRRRHTEPSHAARRRLWRITPFKTKVAILREWPRSRNGLHAKNTATTQVRVSRKQYIEFFRLIQNQSRSLELSTALRSVARLMFYLASLLKKNKFQP